jgi:predicted short-subunit dehydrogenase-like oxidoreductase (DUF2520 family)
MKISFVGSGHAATRLALELRRAGHSIEWIHSLHPAHARRLARRVGARAAASLKQLADAPVIVLAVTDTALRQVSRRLPATSGLVLHTSGTEPLTVLRRFAHHGVLYPLQTLSATEPPQSGIPFCIEAGDAASLRTVRRLARSVSPQVHVLNSAQRRQLHLAAVIANNFSNHLFAVAAGILEQEKLPFRLLRPLIDETARKVSRHDPRDVQTGPAARGDRRILRIHQDLLKGNRRLAAIYRLLSQDILETSSKK